MPVWIVAAFHDVQSPHKQTARYPDVLVEGPARPRAFIKSKPTARKTLTAMHLPTEIPELHPARPPPGAPAWGDEAHDTNDDWLN